MSLFVGVARADLVVPESRSLKDKRRVIRSLCDRLRARKGGFNLSVAEVGSLDLFGRAEIAVACVGNDRRHLEGLLEAFRRFVDDHPGAELLDLRTEILAL